MNTARRHVARRLCGREAAAATAELRAVGEDQRR